MINGSFKPVTLSLIITIDIHLVSFSHLVLDPYRAEFNISPSQSRKPKSEVQDTGDTADTSAQTDKLFDIFGADEEQQMPHRHLFRSYFYQYHLIQICSIIIEMVRFYLYTVSNIYIYRQNRSMKSSNWKKIVLMIDCGCQWHIYLEKPSPSSQKMQIKRKKMIQVRHPLFLPPFVHIFC